MIIDSALSSNPDTDLLGPFTSTDANVEPLCIRTTFYLPTLFVGILVEWDFMAMDSWTHLCNVIVDGDIEVDCLPIIEWLYVTLTMKTGDDKSPLAMPRPTALMADGDLLRHMNHMLILHLSRMDLALQRVQGSLIVTHIGEVAV